MPFSTQLYLKLHGLYNFDTVIYFKHTTLLRLSLYYIVYSNRHFIASNISEY